MDVDTVRANMEEARTVIRDMVEIHSRDTGAENFWLNFVRQGTFELHKGFRQKKKIREQSYIPPDAKWRDVDARFNSGNGKVCTICPIKIQFGSNFREVVLETLEVRGPDICFIELLALQEFEAELRHQYQELTRARRIIYSNRYRDAYIKTAGRKYVMMQGLPYGTADGYFPDPTAGTVGKPHESLLKHVAASFDAAGGYVPGQNAGMSGNSPIYWAICRHEVSDEIFRGDPESRKDIRDSSIANELLQVSHNSTVYKRFRFIEDAEAPRFNYNETTNEWERVNYYKQVDAAIGVVAVENPEYELAKYDCIIFVANRLGPSSQKLPRSVNAGGNTRFGAVHSDFNFSFKNYPDQITNVMEWDGFFLGNAFEAIDPGQSRFVHCVMVARDVNGVTINPATNTAKPAHTDRAIAEVPELPCCEFISPNACSNADKFTCASTTVAGHDNGLVLYPIAAGTVTEGSTYNIAGADGVTFTAVEVDGQKVTFGYADPAVDCADIIKEWQVTPA